MRVAGPPHRFPCHYGIDFSTRGELIAARKSVEELRGFLGLDSLYYLSIEGLIKAVALPRDIFCLACFTGSYPIAVQLEMDKLTLETIAVAKKAPLK